nr:MAG TPA: hypothetical protein [Caudoviricetes sp.]
MRTISQKQFIELNDYFDYNDVDEEFLTKLHEATGITAKPYTSYSFYDENGDYVGNSKNYSLDDILYFADVKVIDRKE